MVLRTQNIPATLKWLSGLILVGALTACGGSDGNDTPRANTAQGPVEGVEEGSMLTFKGIPYAAPPVGELRFMPPQAPAERASTLDASEFGQSCTQPSGGFGTASSGEDCLYLNVYRPKADGDYPVMVWIHGGSLETGSGGGSYDPAMLVAQDVVVVTINYRLGILGFLAHPDLTAESAASASGDYGLMDQQKALEWVQNNIANFSGDPDNVTIFGESAGGHSVLSHLVSPASDGLFHKVIVQSGSYQPGQRTLADAQTQGTTIATDLGCESAADTVACLRGLPATDFRDAQTANGYDYVPNTRSDILPNTIADALSTGSFADVPIMMGTNRDEWRLFVASQTLTRAASGDTTPLLDASEYEGAIQGDLGVSAAAATAIADEYPISDYGTGDDAPSLAQSAVGTDAIFACNALGQAQSASGNGATVYAYEFRDRQAPNILGTDPGFDTGAAHAFEIQYVLSSEAALTARGMSADQIALANTMVDYWTNFAKHGDPNTTDGTGTSWPEYGTSGGILGLDDPDPATLTSTEFGAEHHCSFWAGM